MSSNFLGLLREPALLTGSALGCFGLGSGTASAPAGQVVFDAALTAAPTTAPQVDQVVAFKDVAPTAVGPRMGPPDVLRFGDLLQMVRPVARLDETEVIDLPSLGDGPVIGFTDGAVDDYLPVLPCGDAIA